MTAIRKYTLMKHIRRVVTARVITHMAVLTAVAGLVLTSGGVTSQSAAAPLLANEEGYGGVTDGTASAYIAANLAEELDMPVANEMQQQARDIATQDNLATAADALLTKPYVVATDTVSKRDITTYTVEQGDTIGSLAQKFDVTSDTIRWANDLSEGEILTAGQKLTILPVSGVLHEAQTGDTPEKLANKYNANAQQIISFNDLEVTGLKSGDKVVIPEGVEPEPSYRQFVPTNTFFAAQHDGNSYVYGYCTWYAASVVDVPSNWGNANTWDDYARLSGWTVSSTPKVGAVAQTDRMSYFGHVAIVEDVSADGSKIKYSDMNGIAGWGRAGTTNEWVPASKYENYIYK